MIQVTDEEQAMLESEWGRACVMRAEEIGIDLGLLGENLCLTPFERMQQHDASVRRIIAAQKRLGIDDHDDT